LAIRNAKKHEEVSMSTLLQQRQQPITAPRLRDPVAAQNAAPRASARHQPAAIGPIRPVGAPLTRWRVISGAIVASLREWRRRRVARRELVQLDERILRDIGIDPSIVDYEMRQSFRQPLRDWER
jgi:uncharacterized protein YjiS (DUF1127 family)